jgi:hypothetical protein
VALISIKLDAQDDASKTLDRVKKKLADLGEGSGSAMPTIDVANLPGALRQVATLQGAVGSLARMGAAGALTAVGLEAGQMAFEMGKAGAATLRTRDAYADLAEDAGISGQSMLNAMRTASRGTVADSELMAAANRALVLEVADSADEMARLTAAAITRGRQVGVGATQAVGDLVTGIGRMSPEILDNLGIANAKGAFADYAATLGTTADKLTDVQKKQALVNAVLASVPADGAAVADDAASAFERMDASLTNAKEELGVLFAPAVAAVAEQIARAAAGVTDALAPNDWSAETSAQLGEVNEQLAQAQEALAKLQAQQAQPVDPMWMSIDMQAAGSPMTAEDVGPQTDALNEQIASWERLQTALKRADEFLQAGAPGAQRWVQALGEIATSATAAGSMTSEQVGAVERLIAAMTAAESATGSLAEKEEAAASAGSILAEIERQIADSAGGMQDALGRAGSAVDTIRKKFILAGLAGSAAFGKLSNLDLEGQANQIRQGLGNLGFYEPDDIEFYVDLNTEQALASADDMLQLLQDVETAGSGAASGIGSSFDDAGRSIDSVRSKVQGLLQQSLSLDVDWPGKDAGQSGGGDAINENAKRLAAIANEGLIGQGWLDEFAQEAPSTYADLMLKIAAGMDARGAAQQLMAEFQAGMRPDLLDFGQLKEQVKQQLLGEQALAGMADQLTAELVAEMDGVSAGQVQSALAGILGSTPGGALAAQDLDLGGAGDGAGASLRGGIVAGFEADGMALEILAKIDAEFAAEKKGVEDSGKAVGAVWGGGFMTTVGNNIPVGLLDLFTAKLLPMILASLALQGSRTGAES